MEGNPSHVLLAGGRSPKEFFQVSVLQKVLKVPGPPPVARVLRSSPEVNQLPVVHRLKVPKPLISKVSFPKGHFYVSHRGFHFSLDKNYPVL
jgi:hypothetical protein